MNSSFKNQLTPTGHLGTLFSISLHGGLGTLFFNSGSALMQVAVALSQLCLWIET